MDYGGQVPRRPSTLDSPGALFTNSEAAGPHLLVVMRHVVKAARGEFPEGPLKETESDYGSETRLEVGVRRLDWRGAQRAYSLAWCTVVKSFWFL